WTEVACRGKPVAQAYTPILDQRRDESRTFTTYPEWHIVHAYDDYARTIATGDPDDFGFFRAIRGFWSSLCPMARLAGEHGGFTTESKMTIYTIGVSFSVEMALKAAYEETLGRVATWFRGPTRAPLDDLSARQAADYAAFLTQTPWYQWDFRRDAAALDAQATPVFRDRERRLALGLEYRAKAAYADAIRAAVAATGQDALTLRAIVTGLDDRTLAEIPGVTVIADRKQGVEIETPRYRAFTEILRQIADKGGDMVEIAGNDQIMLTAITPDDRDLGAIFAFPRQGYGDWRQLIVVPVPELTQKIRDLAAAGVRLEHVHDY
ncbi:hypothetical protein, partial [Paracoccus pacificus]